MKFANVAGGWITEGALITILPAGKPVDAKCMALYYGFAMSNPLYLPHQCACPFTRAVLMRPTGVFVIVPLTPMVTIVNLAS